MGTAALQGVRQQQAAWGCLIMARVSQASRGFAEGDDVPGSWAYGVSLVLWFLDGVWEPDETGGLVR